MTHKILFLDLPNTLIIKGEISQAAVIALNRLTAGSGADVVLLPTWTDDLALADLRWLLADAGVTANVVDCTPCVPAFGRSGEIQYWLDEHRWHVASYVIVSSDSEFVEEFANRLILVDDPLGLTLENAADAAAKLGL